MVQELCLQLIVSIIHEKYDGNCWLSCCSATFSLAASVAFLNSFAEGGEQAPFQVLSFFTFFKC